MWQNTWISFRLTASQKIRPNLQPRAVALSTSEAKNFMDLSYNLHWLAWNVLCTKTLSNSITKAIEVILNLLIGLSNPWIGTPL